jgi:hypothetical protein
LLDSFRRFQTVFGSQKGFEICKMTESMMQCKQGCQVFWDRKSQTEYQNKPKLEPNSKLWRGDWGSGLLIPFCLTQRVVDHDEDGSRLQIYQFTIIN